MLKGTISVKTIKGQRRNMETMRVNTFFPILIILKLC
jgi:hypothetical protein